MNQSANDEFITRKQAADILKKKYNTLASWKSRYPNKLRIYKVGRDVRYRKSDIIALHVDPLIPE